MQQTGLPFFSGQAYGQNEGGAESWAQTFPQVSPPPLYQAPPAAQQPAPNPFWTAGQTAAPQAFSAPGAYSAPAYPSQSFPAQSFPAQSFPAQSFPAPTYTAPAYAAPAPQASPVPQMVQQPAGPALPQQAGSQQQNQNPLVRQLVGIARALEQVMPSFQLAISVTDHIVHSPKGQDFADGEKLAESLKGAAYYHGATLGAVRRLLLGETTPDVMLALATAISELTRLHSRMRSQLDQAQAAVLPDLKPLLTGLVQALATAEAQLSQASAQIQATVGATVWDTAQGRVTAAG